MAKFNVILPGTESFPFPVDETLHFSVIFVKPVLIFPGLVSYAIFTG